MRDHGGNPDAAMQQYGGAADRWTDLSTGINPTPYPVPRISAHAWNNLPTRSDLNGLSDVAAKAYRTSGAIVPLAGAQALIQIAPLLRSRGRARVLGPTYNEHAAAFRTAGWQVDEVEHFRQLAGADAAVVVNPNNPDGKTYAPDDLLALKKDVGLLIVDESFGDVVPHLSCAPFVDKSSDGILIARSFGKFYGLAGARLGFSISGAKDADRLRDLSGPWPVSGPAVCAGLAALQDTDWQADTILRLEKDAGRLDLIAGRAGWTLVGGTTLFRTYLTPDAEAAQASLAGHQIWTRIFPYSPTWIRLGLPGTADGWTRLEAAL